MHKLVIVNQTMLDLTGVPIGQGLAPGYRLREEYAEILRLAGTKASDKNVAELERLVLAFRAKI